MGEKFDKVKKNKGCGCGCGSLFTVGGVIAMFISYLYNGVSLWVLWHGILGWWYVAWRVITDLSGILDRI